jgi:hypothetical protein
MEPSITANPDMVQEVRVQTSNYAAEHGSSACTGKRYHKERTKDFHGSLYDYIRTIDFKPTIARTASITWPDRRVNISIRVATLVARFRCRVLAKVGSLLEWQR